MGKLEAEIVALRGVPDGKKKIRLAVNDRDYITDEVNVQSGAANFNGERYSFFVPAGGHSAVLDLSLLDSGFMGDTVIGEIKCDLAKVSPGEEHTFSVAWSGRSGGQCFLVLRHGGDGTPLVAKQQPQLPIPAGAPDPQLQQQQLYYQQLQQMAMQMTAGYQQQQVPVMGTAYYGQQQQMPQPGFMYPPGMMMMPPQQQQQQQQVYQGSPVMMPGVAGFYPSAPPSGGYYPGAPAAAAGNYPGGGSYPSMMGAGAGDVTTGVPSVPAVGSVVAPPTSGGGAGPSGGVGGSSAAAAASAAASAALGEMPNPPPGSCDLGRDVEGEHLGAGVVIRDTAVSGARLESVWGYDAHIRNSQIIGGAYEGCSFKSAQLFSVSSLIKCKFEDCTLDANCVVYKAKSMKNCDGAFQKKD
jgi:hypothetical protein